MTNSEPLGRNQAMKMILGQAQEDEFDCLKITLNTLRLQIRHADFPQEKLKIIKSELNEIAYLISKELMNGPADSRVSDIMPRRTTQGTSDSTD